MAITQRFSNRRGFRPALTEITVREDAPQTLREAVVQIARDHGVSPAPQRQILCRVLHILPDDNNWSEYPNVLWEVQRLIADCHWYLVYDYIEALDHEIAQTRDPTPFADDINQFFAETGIGWQLHEGRIEVRGPEAFEAALTGAAEATAADLPTANREIREALHDLSRRPEPDLTGSIQHALAALECIARHATGDPKATLGVVISKNPDLFPKPLDAAAEKLWGYASEQARHLREGVHLSREEVELAVGLAAQLATFLVRRLTK